MPLFLGCWGHELSHGLFGEVAAVSGGPFIMLLDEDRSREAQQGFGIREHSDDIGTPLDLLIDPFD